MVYSIVCHLWKKSKVEKKFSPLPPLPKPLQQLQINSVTASTMDEDLDSTYLEESNYEFIIERFSHKSDMNIEQVIPIKTIKPLIEGGSTEIGELDYFLSIYETESVYNQKMLDLENQERFYAIKGYNIAIQFTDLTFTSDLKCSLWFELKKLFSAITMTTLEKIIEHIIAVTTSPQSFIFDPGGIIDLPLNATVLDYYGEILRRELRFHNNSNTDLVITVFDPGGVIKPFSVAMLGGTITFLPFLLLIFRLVIVLAIAFAGEFVVTVFDPGGNPDHFPSHTLESISQLLFGRIQFLYYASISRETT
jgi:hypothetical protein